MESTASPRDQVLGRIAELVSAVANIPSESIRLGVPLVELSPEFDSLMLLGIQAELETHFDIDLKQQAASDRFPVLVDDLVDMVLRRLSDGTPGGTAGASL